ncbi:Myb-like DNA-binding domain containing protein [Trichomonas vaginalis G3]|uniref:Myb-like DNA-binding domain containing protein n=1 Tax=Trichomonas vaginalis (strain ATCC PRA-98 / G3) TaxID=412133 RepID=A2EVH9_TRIV3|nr:RNA polymerase II transcription regulator recruiting protein [Trichomonas vaginalis G3]EAY03365.1 Myb-like DNA-binding domain containing protein [Trichomonas vaginalis G3]KAI5518840.1 RNA polymerase II transcription regulator recruiting protein [Trichomonas vaginalis G3]|eukprot:XP_001315588.1 Myb-like DNA-binding domain containing protein [Trichomonas vaginalis G3]
MSSYDDNSLQKICAKVKFSIEQDNTLKELVQRYGASQWEQKAALIPGKTARQCRDRWFNYLDPKLNQEAWTDEEDQKLIKKYLQVGPHWKIIADYLDNRSTNSVRNRLLKLQRKQCVPESNYYSKKKSGSIQSKKANKEMKQIVEKSEDIVEQSSPGDQPIGDFNSVFDQLFDSKNFDIDSLLDNLWV